MDDLGLVEAVNRLGEGVVITVAHAAAGSDRLDGIRCVEDQPVCLGGVFLVGLSFEDANELMNVLNRQDLEIERTARRLVAEAMRPRSQGFKPLPARPS